MKNEDRHFSQNGIVFVYKCDCMDVWNYMYCTLENFFCCPEDIYKIDYVCVQGKECKSPAEGLMTVSELRQLAKEQLQIELNSYVQVKTIEKRTEPDDTILYYVSGIRFFFFYSCLSPAKYCFRWNPNCG